MNRHRVAWVPFLAIVSVVFPWAGEASTETLREQSERVVEARDVTVVRIENSRGLVLVREGAAQQVRITALKVSRGEHEAAVRYARATQVVADREGDRLVVRVIYPQRQALKVSFWDAISGFEFPRVEVRLSLDVPSGMAVRIGTTSGDIDTEGLSGEQTIQTTSGDIAVAEADGPLEISSTSGDIDASAIGSARMRTVSGDIRIEAAKTALDVHTTSGEIQVSGITETLEFQTVSGHIQADGASRRLNVRTTSGDVAVSRASGAVYAETTSGEITLGLRGPLSQAEVTSASGDIEVRLGGSLGCALDVRTSSGTLAVDVPMEVETVSRRVVAGVVRDGSTRVRLRSSSGDIAVRGGGN